MPASAKRSLPERFATAEYQVLLVAEKYQTGFDQPLLHTMYVDRRLAGIQAVQTLSRINRVHPLKEDTFILDFVNDRQEIQAAFKQFYEGAEMGELVQPALMYEIGTELTTLRDLPCGGSRAVLSGLFQTQGKAERGGPSRDERRCSIPRSIASGACRKATRTKPNYGGES